MKPRRNLFLGSFLIAFSMAQAAQAGSLEWKGSTSGLTGGTDLIWNTNTTANWWNGVANVNWPALGGLDDDAVFGGTAGTVTITTATANDITFNTTGYILTGGVLTLNGGTTPTITNATGIDATISSKISGSAGLTKLGGGILTLSGANDYTGTTTISAGILKAGNAAALGSSAQGTSVSSGATLDIGGQKLGTEVITISGTGVGGNGAIINSGVQQIDALGRIVLAADATIGGANRWDLRNSTPTLNLAGFTLTKTGANYIGLIGVAVTPDNGANTGDIIINQGELNISTGTNLGGDADNTVTINNGGTLGFYQSSSAHAWTLNLNTGSTLRGENGLATQNIWAGAVNANGNFTLLVEPDDNLTVQGAISGTGGLTKTGTGTAYLTGNNSLWSGGITISAGSLRVNSANSLGTNTTITTSGSNNAALVLNNVTIGTGKTITVVGQGNQNLYGALSTSSTNTASIWQSAVTIGALTGTRIGSEAGTLTVSGNIGQSAAGSKLTIRNNGSAATILSGNNTFSGGLDLIVGGLRMGSTNALGNAAGIFTIANGTNAVVFSSDGTTARNIVNPTAVTGTSNITIGDATNNGKLTFSNTFDLGTSVRPLAIASEVEISGAVGGTGGGINKSGAGVLTLSGNNNYTGLTTVSAGQLNLNSNNAINGGGGLTLGGTIDNTSANAVTLGNVGTVTMGGNFNFGGTRDLNLNPTVFNQTTAASIFMYGTANLTIGDFVNKNAGATSILNVAPTGTPLGTGTVTIGAMALSDSTTGKGYTINQNSNTAANGTVVVNGVISDSAVAGASASNLTIGRGTVTLAGNNLFSGGLTFSGGTLNMNNAGALGTGTFTIGGGTLNNTTAAAITNSKNNAITVNADFTFTGTRDLNLGNGAVSLGTAAGTARQITVSGGILTLGGAISNGTTANALNKAGAGTLVLSGTNGYTGATGVKNGTIVIGGGNDRLLTTGSVVLGDTATTGKLVLGDGTARNQTLAGLTTTGLGGSVVGGAAANSTLTLNIASGTNTYTGFLGGSGTNENNLAITKTGAGSLILGLSSSVAPIANTFTGGVDIQAGVLSLANALGSGGQVATPGGNSSGVFYLGSSGGTSTAELAIANNNITFNNPINVRSGSSGTKTFRISGSSVNASHAGTVTLNDNLTVSTAATSSTLSLNGVIEDGVSGAKGITVSGGLVLVSNTNTYTGTTSVTGGTLTATKAAALPGYNSSGKVVVNGGTLQVRVAGSGWTGTELASLVTNATKTSGSLAIDTTNDNFTPTSALNIGALGLVKNGTNTLTLDQANSFSGNVTVNAGTLKIADSGALGTGTKTLISTGGSRVVQLSGGVTLGSNISLSMSSNTGDGLGLSSIAGDNKIEGNINYTTGNPAFNISSSGTSKLTISGNVTYTVAGNTRTMYLGGDSAAANVISGDVGQSGTGAVLNVYKQGTGTWVLSGSNNNYTGATQVNAGKLLINGNISTSTTTVKNTATLGGNGTTGAITVESGGKLAPGNSIDLLTASGNVNLASGSIFEVEIDTATSYDKLGINLGGDLNITSGAKLGLLDFGSASLIALNSRLQLIDYSSVGSTWNGGLFTLGTEELSDSETFVWASQNWLINYDDTLVGSNSTLSNGGNYVTLTAVPEPRAALLGGLGMLMLLRRRR